MLSWKVKALVYASGIWRRRWVCLGAAWLLCLAGWTLVALLPNQFEGEAKVYIDTETMMQPLLRGLTVTTDADQQVSVMLRTLLTRPNLEQVVRQTDPNAASLSPADLESKIARLEQEIAIRPLGSKNLFSIAYRSRDPATAQAVTQTLVSILADSNIGNRRRDIQGAETFIDSQVAEYETLLREAEQKRAHFKEEHVDYFSHGENGLQLGPARSAYEQAKTELSLAQTRRDALRAQLSVTPRMLDVDAPVSVVINGNGAAPSDARAAIEQKLQQACQNLAELQSRYTADYPDVIAGKRLVAELESELNAAPAGAKPADARRQSVSNAVFEQIRVRLAEEETNVALQEQRLADAGKQLEEAQRLAEKSAEVEAQYADLNRDYGIIQKNYQELLERRESAKLSKAVDERQQNISFRVVEPPRKQLKPVAPNRKLFNSAVLLLGLAGGIGLGVFLTLTSDQIHVSDELKESFDLPVIGVISRLPEPGNALRSRRAALRASGMAALLLVCYLGVVLIR